MTKKNYILTTLICALLVISLGGWLLHMRIHPIDKNPAYFIPFLSGLASVLVVPLLFSFRKTIHAGYVLNGMLVILGTITMAHLSLEDIPYPLTISALLFKTTLPDIIILLSKFLLGKAIFDLVIFGFDASVHHTGIWWRYPNIGWWWVHFVLISFVYTLGHLLW